MHVLRRECSSKKQRVPCAGAGTSLKENSTREFAAHVHALFRYIVDNLLWLARCCSNLQAFLAQGAPDTLVPARAMPPTKRLREPEAEPSRRRTSITEPTGPGVVLSIPCRADSACPTQGYSSSHDAKLSPRVSSSIQRSAGRCTHGLYSLALCSPASLKPTRGST